MSQTESKASDEAFAERQNVSVYDFLYCDSRRIGAFLSQFDELGVPTRVSISESVEKARGRAFKFGAGGGIAGVGNATLNIERGPSVIGGQKNEARDYDPLWANALALLDYLESNWLLCREIGSARIGQFVVVSGSLALMDLTLFKGLWSLPAVREAILANTEPQKAHVPESRNRHERRAAKSPPRMSPGKSPEQSTVEASLALVGMLPHTIQVRIAPSDNAPVVWSSLREDSMVVAASDLMLKHGVAIAGEWSMLGILDALPDTDANGTTVSGAQGVVRSLALSDSPFGQMMFQMMPHLRPLLGRPFHSYGITPLLIFREVLPQSESRA